MYDPVMDMTVTSPSGKPSLTAGVYERIRVDVLACRLVPGQRLKIAELAQSLRVSPGAVREGLSRLAAEGLVVAESQKGFRVAPVSASDLVDLTRTRLEIEASCLRRAVAAGDVPWESRLVAALHRLSRTPERSPDDERQLGDHWAAAHAEFHAALVSACDSPWLLRLRALLYDQSERYRRLSVPLAPSVRDIGGEHRAIVEAAISRDADLAVMLLSQHLSATTRILQSSGITVDSPSLHRPS